MAPDRLAEVVAEGSRNDCFHRVYRSTEWAMSTRLPPADCAAKLLTSGGLYRSMEAYGELIRNSGNVRVSISVLCTTMAPSRMRWGA